MQAAILLLNALGLPVLAVCLFFAWKALNDRITNLTTLAREQKETLEAVRSRATELDQMRKDYKQGLEDFQELGVKLNERRNELVKEYEAALQKKDDQLASAKQLELKELEIQQNSLALLPELQERLATAALSLETQISALASLTVPPHPFQHASPIDLVLARSGRVTLLSSLFSTDFSEAPSPDSGRDKIRTYRPSREIEVTPELPFSKVVK
jgi:hypothetical protein